MPAAKIHYSGYIAWRGLVDNSELPSEARHVLGGKFGFYPPPKEQILGSPVGGAGDSSMGWDHGYNFVWYRPAAEPDELEQLLTDHEGRRHVLSIPPDRIRAGVIAQMLADAQRVLARSFAQVVSVARQPFIQTVCDLDSPRRSAGRVALVGDSAFGARPHVGMGVTKAAEDARALARALEQMPDDVPAALASFERERYPTGAKIVAHGRYLGGLIKTVPASAAQRDRIAREILARTAAPPG
jgi:2-polyprenyl-6-methoxyphenol hydroxylase-like FAD-dependent oxidoreductase